MNEALTKIKKSRFLNVVKSILSSKYFPFITAIFSLLCYYLGLDLVFIYYIGITGLLTLLLLDDCTPMITVLLFMTILVSSKNSPSNIMNESNYYFKPAVLAQVFIVIGALGSAIIYRVVMNIVKKKFSLTPTFFGLCAFAVVLLLNGVFSKDYTPKNLVYGLVMALCFLGIFTALKDNLVLNDDSFERIALSFFALSVVLIIELFVAYLTTEGLYVNGVFHREKLTFGWGIWNTMGMMLLICIPSVLYLAGKYKYGFGFTIYSVLLFAANWLSCSRQAMLASIVIYLISVIILLVKGKNRLANLCVIVAALVLAVILIIVFRNTVVKYFSDLLSKLVDGDKISGNGRVKLWEFAIENFEEYPIFGIGFYFDFYNKLSSGYNGYSGMSFIPQMCHNTIFELMSACGIVGLAAYIIHTIQISVSFFRDLNLNRTFIAVTILALAGISLVDNHIFNIFPTIIYSLLVAILIASEKQPEEEVEKLPLRCC